MLKKMKNRLKDQRGLTLIELLAVIVILGIIAAIAIPSITGIINNSKKDAHIANAEQIASSAKLYIADTKVSLTSTATPITLTTLINNGYLETIDDPSNIDYNPDTTIVYVTKTSAASAADTFSYEISLTSTGAADATTYIGDGTEAGAVDVSTLERTNVELP